MGSFRHGSPHSKYTGYGGEHARLFPQSRKRIYVALSLLLLFLILIAVLTASLLITGRPWSL